MATAVLTAAATSPLGIFHTPSPTAGMGRAAGALGSGKALFTSAGVVAAAAISSSFSFFFLQRCSIDGRRNRMLRERRPRWLPAAVASSARQGVGGVSRAGCRSGR